MIIPRPAADEHAPYYQRYIALVPDGDLLASLERRGRETAAMLRQVPAARTHFRYQPEKWSVLEVIGHVVDTERVFSYRGLSFSRGDTTALPSFDENAWVPGSGADDRALESLVAEFEAVRAATVALFGGMTAEQVARRGTASGKPMSARAAAWVIAGHERHHVALLHERYGI